MISYWMLALINLQLWQAFPKHNNEQFGKRSVIMFDNFGQLPPVLDLLIYTNIKWDVLSNSSLAIYKQFKKAYKFDIIQHQSENSREQ